MRRIFVIGFILLTVQSFDVDALEPCLSGDFCPRDTTDAYPETGLWFDPSEPGSGFMFEIQNRTLAGYYFGYDESGKPAWHLISGQLIVAENESAAWHLETILHSFSGGNCLGCPYADPGPAADAGTITLRFHTRNVGEFTIDGEVWHPIQSFTFGSLVADVFPDTNYPMPKLDGQWVIIVSDRDAKFEDPRFAAWGTEVRIISDSFPGGIGFLISVYLRVPEIQVLGVGECRTNESEVGATCTIRVSQPPLEPKEYHMPSTAISDSYFRAVADDGDTIEAFRVNYN